MNKMIATAFTALSLTGSFAFAQTTELMFMGTVAKNDKYEKVRVLPASLEEECVDAQKAELAKVGPVPDRFMGPNLVLALFTALPQDRYSQAALQPLRITYNERNQIELVDVIQIEGGSSLTLVVDETANCRITSADEIRRLYLGKK